MLSLYTFWGPLSYVAMDEAFLQIVSCFLVRMKAELEEQTCQYLATMVQKGL